MPVPHFLKLYGARYTGEPGHTSLKLCILCTLPISACLHPPDHPVFPLALPPYLLIWTDSESRAFRRSVLSVSKVESQCSHRDFLTVLLKNSTRRNFGRKDAQVSGCFNNFQDAVFLFKEIRLLRQWRKARRLRLEMPYWVVLDFQTTFKACFRL